MKRKTLLLLLEAYRRWVAIGSNPDKSLGDKWLGLGTDAEYRPIIKEGYMIWVNYEAPDPRIMGWLKLTTKGEEVIRQIARVGIGEQDFEDFDFIGWNKLSQNSFFTLVK